MRAVRDYFRVKKCLEDLTDALVGLIGKRCHLVRLSLDESMTFTWRSKR